MKKLAVITMAALLALTVCAAALANETASELFEKTRDLLFRTENVTLKATAEFALDGDWFKTAEGTWKQDGDRSFRELVLRAPRADGTERRNGYTIVTEGDRLFLMEAFTPGVYRPGYSAGRRSILRNTVESEALCNLAGALFSQADLLLGEGAVSRTAEGGYLLKLDGNAPEMANAALNQLVRFAAKRYFDMDFDLQRTDRQQSLYSFITVTEGLLYTTQSAAVRQAEITVQTDAEGRIARAEGTAALDITTSSDGVKQLDIRFTAEVSDTGSTEVKAFKPEDYGVTQAPDMYMVMDSGEEITGETLPENGALIDQIEMRAMEIWAETGFDSTATTSVACRTLEDGYEVSFDGGYEETLKSYFTPDGQFTFIQAEPSGWQNRNIEEYTYDPAPDAETDRKAKEFLMGFLERISPEKLETVKDLKMEWMFEADGAVYAQYNEEPLDQEGDGVLFVVRLSPEMRIEYYSCVSNG